MFERDQDQIGFIGRHVNRSAGAPSPASHFDWLDVVLRWPRLRAREKVLGSTIATWAIDPVTGETDWSVERLAEACGSTVRSMEVALTNLAAGGWIETRESEDGRTVHRLTLPIFDGAHPDFEPMARLAAITVGAAMEHLEHHDSIPREAILSGALAAVAAAIGFHHGDAETARRLRDLAFMLTDPEAWANAPTTGPSGG
ncbi:hypothetical protein [Ruixingdingia sedimenti]|uniref:MarR family protein n=1 Tax=Ruixingdingia sedimenti TaxID=3073604 RepID=A0ABU1FFA2_9RHOB|nr:hypothetical protein [Xinfangfangia sp. LG-4]MDR5655253.1 hypothetical protein [Xinfangfangia sp. LG-4]